MASIEDDIVISCIRTVVVKTCSTAATLAWFSVERLLDLIGLVFNLVAICTIVRAYPTIHLIWQYKDDKDWRFWTWRGAGLFQILIFISDIPFAIMLLLETIFFWRLGLLLYKKDKKNKKWFETYCWRDFGYIGFEIRADIFKSFLGLMTDFLVIPFAIPVFCSWRARRAYNKLGTYDLARKYTLMKEFFLLLIDVCIFVLFVIQCLTWRLPVMIFHLMRWIDDYRPSNSRAVAVTSPDGDQPASTARPPNTDEMEDIDLSFRLRILYSFLKLILDIMMLPLVILLLFSWRAPILFKKFVIFRENLSGKNGSYSKRRAEWYLRGAIATHSLRYCIDLATLVPISIVFCSWRFPILIMKFQRFFKSNMKRQDEFDLRYSILFHAGQVVIDLLSIPPMLITILSWRLIFFIQMFPLSSSKSVSRKFKKVRLQFWWEFLFFLLDIPVIVAFSGTVCFCWCFPWRLLKVFDSFTEFRQISSDSKSTWWKIRFQMNMRLVILASFAFTLCDIFTTMFGLIVFATLWRFPFLIKEISDIRKSKNLSKGSKTSFDIHIAVFKEFVLLFVDLFMFIFLVLIFGTLWRIKPMVRKIIKHSKPENPSKDDDDGDDEDVEDEVPGALKVSVPCDDVGTVGIDPIGIKDDEDSVMNESKTAAIEQHTETTIIELTEVNTNEQQDTGGKDNKIDDIPEVDIISKKKLSISDIFFGARGWKIRKAICLNIFGLFLDIPSFVMLALNSAFVYQIPILLQRFLECGDFYQEFFFIMVDETNHLLQDIAFFLVFLVLTIVRPVAVWINFLEDKDHLKAKKSKEYLNKLRHIIKQRIFMQHRLDSALSVFVKYHQLYSSMPDSVSKRFIDEVMVYIEEIKDSRDKMLERELDDRLIYLLSNIYFYESKKPYLFSRRYILEEMYCLKPCVSARQKNLEIWNGDMKVLNDKLEEFYEQLDNFKVDMPPLWSDKNGFLLRTRKQNQRVIIHTITSGYFGTIAMFLLNSIFIYRVPVMIKNMLKVSYCRFRVREACLEQTKEYFRDLLAILKILLVVLSIYRCPALLSDLAHDLLSKRSLSAARKTANRYPVNILKDLFKLLSLIFRWDTVVFLFASLLFVILIPLSVIINTIKATNLCESVGIIFILSIPIYAFIMCGPFIIVHKISEVVLSDIGTNDSSIAIYIAGFLGIIGLVMAAFVVAMTKRKDEQSRKVKTIDYIRYNWFNAQVVFQEVLELVQLLALVFSIRNLVLPYATDIRTVAQYILLDIYNYKIRFGFLVTLFIIWLIVCTVPTLLEGVTKKVEKGHFSSSHFVWRSFLSFFGITLFVALPEMSVSLLACDYTDCTNATVCPSLFDDADIACWSGVHLILAPISFFMMVWYVLTSLLYCMQYTDVTNRKVDLQFSPPYSALVNLFKLAMVVGVGLFSEEKVSVLVFVIALMVILIISSLLFPLITGMDVSNAKGLLIWRIESFIIILFIALGVLAFEVIDMTESYKSWSENSLIFNDTTRLIDFVIPAAVLTLIVISLIICLILTRIFRTKSVEEKARSEFKNIISEIIIPVVAERKPNFIPHWNKVSKPLMRMLKSVRVADKNDKDFEAPAEEYVNVDGLPPPPSYDEEMMYVPLPPSYNDAVDSPEAPEIAADISPLPTETTSCPEDDEFFLPTPAMYLVPIGAYKKYDAACQLETILRKDPNPGGIFKAGWVLNETVPGAKEKQLSDSHCTGIELLLLLEEHISYESCSYEFIVSLQDWRNLVRRSNWIGLRDCALKLQNNLTSTYHRPREIVRAEESDILPPHKDDSHLPAYVPLADITSLKLKLHKKGVEKLMSLLPEPWVSVFRRIIPSGDSDTPLIYKVTLGSEDDSNLWNIKVEMFKEVEIVIKGIEGDGFKAAVGASIILTNPIVISRIRKWNRRINFGKPFPYGKKGMLSHNITSCSCKEKNGSYSLVAAGKSVKLNKVLNSLAQLEWRFRD